MPEIKLNVDVNKLPWMKCVCGGEKFVKVAKLKLISAFYAGGGQDLTWEVPVFKCMNPKCGMEFDSAKSEAYIKDLKKTLKEKQGVIFLDKGKNDG